MPKDDRVVTRSIHMGGGSPMLGPDTDPDEVENALTPDQVKRLVAKGALTGNWTGRAKAETKEQAASDKAAAEKAIADAEAKAAAEKAALEGAKGKK